jgi:uncharacterized membrane protein
MSSGLHVRRSTGDPSAWPRRLLVIALALAGLAIAIYLTCYQLAWIPQVWEPFFGTGSSWILKDSPVARRLPIPDAALGAAAYLAEAVLEVIGGRERWRRLPWLVIALGAVAVGLAVAGVVLVVLQAVFGRFCTLCLASATCSILAALAASPEVLAALRWLRR